MVTTWKRNVTPDSKNNDLEKVRIWEIFFNAKNEKIFCKSQYILARFLTLGLYDSSEANSLDAARK